MWLSQSEGIGEVTYAWVASHEPWVEWFIRMGGSNSGSDQTLEFEFGSSGALSRRDEILDSEMGPKLRGIVIQLMP